MQNWKKLREKVHFVSKPKCLNGIKELNIESDGRAILCQMGAPEESALTLETVHDYDFNLQKFFDSKEVRRKRLNCQTCSLNCQQHIYFNPGADNIFRIFLRFFTIPFESFFLKRRSRL